MRILLTLVFVLVPAAAQIPLVSLLNTSHPGSEFQIGDRFEIVLTGTPKQPVSVRTTMHGRIDWSPIIGTTDSAGRWSTKGQFEKSDFGSWREVWTVGGKLAIPDLQFSVNAPCLPGGQSQSFISGPNTLLSCETAQGHQTFATPSLSDSFRTPDGRLVDGRRPSEQTQEQYQSEVLQHLMGNGMGSTPVAIRSSRGALGDETAGLISKLIGVNALTEVETRNSLAILRAAFAKPQNIQPMAKEPLRTLILLRHLAEITDPGSLKKEIDETIAYFQTR